MSDGVLGYILYWSYQIMRSGAQCATKCTEARMSGSNLGAEGDSHAAIAYVDLPDCMAAN